MAGILGGEKESVGPGYEKELAQVFDLDCIPGVHTLQPALHAGVVLLLHDVGVFSGELALEIQLQIAKEIEGFAVNLEETDGVFLRGDCWELDEILGESDVCVGITNFRRV
jgi:hypothetical protein